MLSSGMRISYAIIGVLLLGSGVGLTIVLKKYLDMVNGALYSVSLEEQLISYVPITALWGMVVPFFLNGLLGILAAAVGEQSVSAVYLAFCILGLLSGLVFGTFSIYVAIASNTNENILNCLWSTGLSTNCIDGSLSTLGSTIAGIHAGGWLLTLIGSIFGCVGTCCSDANRQANAQPTTTSAFILPPTANAAQYPGQVHAPGMHVYPNSYPSQQVFAPQQAFTPQQAYTQAYPEAYPLVPASNEPPNYHENQQHQQQSKVNESV